MGAKAHFWKGDLSVRRSSSMTQAAYCHEHSLSVLGFGYWRRTLKTAGSATSAAVLPIVIGETSGEGDPIAARCVAANKCGYHGNGVRGCAPDITSDARSL